MRGLLIVGVFAAAAWSVDARALDDVPARPPARTLAAADIPRTLADAQAACDAFDLEKCVELGLALLGAPDLGSEEQSVVYGQLAASYAVMGDPTESERYYRLLLRLKPELDLPPETPPKILVVFRNVQADERRLRDAMKEAEKKRRREGIEVQVNAPRRSVGGTPLVIAALVKSRMGGVEAVSLRFRRDPSEQFATLPMVKTGKARYEVAFPAAQTAGERDRTWQYFVVVQGEGSEVLRTEGSAEAALGVDITAGAVPNPPAWRQPRLWVAIAVPTVAAATAVALLAVTAAGGSLAGLWLYSIQPPRSALGTQRM